MSKKDYTPFQVLAKDDVYKIWINLGNEDSANKTNNRQTKIQDMIRIGYKVIQGEVALITNEKKALYDAIETLLRQGVIPIANSSSEQSLQTPEQQPRKRPDLTGARTQFRDHRK